MREKRYIYNLIDVSKADTKHRVCSDNYINSSHPKYTTNNSIKFNEQTSFDTASNRSAISICLVRNADLTN